MCGRFANPFESVQEWNEHFGINSFDPTSDTTMGYNTAPTQKIPIVTKQDILISRWGLIPPWVSEVSTKYATHNARRESVAIKVTFKGAWSAKQRCVVPALGYYEWKLEGDCKQPYFVRSLDSSPLAFAGLYEPARNDDIPASCTILTMPAQDNMKVLHPRMPVLLGISQAKQWLNCHFDCEAPFTFELQMHRVGKAVNTVRNQSISLIKPITH